VQRTRRAVGDWDQMIGTEGLPAPIAVELGTARTEKRATGWVGARVNFQEDVSALFVPFQWKAIEVGVAEGAGSGTE